MPDALPRPPDPFTGLLVRFAGELRAAGLAVGSGDVLVYCSALARLDPSDLVDLYWAGRTTLVSRHDDIARYDEVFRRFFLGADGPDEELALMLRASAQAQGTLAIPAVEPGDSGEEDDAVLGWMASDVDALKHKSFAACTPDRTRRAAPHHGQDPADTASPADPAQRRRQVRNPSRPAADRPGIHAHARRARHGCTGGGGRSGCGRWS